MQPRELKLIVNNECVKRDIEVEYVGSNGHHIFDLRKNGQRRRLSVASSPRSGENLKNWIRQDIKRLDKDLSAKDMAA